MLNLKAANKSYGILLPQDLKEITPEILKAVSDEIYLPKFHAIVALCFHVKLMDIAINVNSDKEQAMTIVPLLVKISDEDAERMNTAVGRKIVIDRSSLERGIHLNLPTMISSKQVSAYIRSNEDLRKNLMNGGDGSDKPLEFIEDKSAKDRQTMKLNKSPLVYVLEFKIVPVTDISASISTAAVALDPFKSTPTALVS